jgi:hypothetical protein
VAPEGWEISTIDQIKAKTERAIAIGPFGSRMKSNLYVPNGVPVIRGNNISDTRALLLPKLISGELRLTPAEQFSRAMTNG